MKSLVLSLEEMKSSVLSLGICDYLIANSTISINSTFLQKLLLHTLKKTSPKFHEAKMEVDAPEQTLHASNRGMHEQFEPTMVGSLDAWEDSTHSMVFREPVMPP